MASWRDSWPLFIFSFLADELWHNGHAAFQSIMPAFSGIAEALGKTFPELHGKFAGEAHVSP